MRQALPHLEDFLHARTEKKVTTETVVEPVEIILKKNIFQFNEKSLKHLRGTAIGTKFAPTVCNSVYD